MESEAAIEELESRVVVSLYIEDPAFSTRNSSSESPHIILSQGAAMTGGTDRRGMFYGSGSMREQVKCFGIEDFWGNLDCLIDGIWVDPSMNIWLDFVNHGPASANRIFEEARRDETTGQITYSRMLRPHGTTELGFIPQNVTYAQGIHFPDGVSLMPGDVAFGGHWMSGNRAGAFRMLCGVNCASSQRGTRLTYL